ncbi:MAG TPA: STAS domain-containing protein [Streptosporangiaceae bacterium]|nr:STAS domain-containing protein [Streptosporangiaceae bacterium]
MTTPEPPSTSANGTVIVTLPAEIDLANARDAGDQVLSRLEPGVRLLILDMTPTRFCDSSGIAMVLRAHIQARAEGAEVRLVVSSGHVLRVMTITGLTGVVPMFPSVNDALGATARHPPG